MCRPVLDGMCLHSCASPVVRTRSQRQGPRSALSSSTDPVQITGKHSCREAISGVHSVLPSNYSFAVAVEGPVGPPGGQHVALLSFLHLVENQPRQVPSESLDFCQAEGHKGTDSTRASTRQQERAGSALVLSFLLPPTPLQLLAGLELWSRTKTAGSEQRLLWF